MEVVNKVISHHLINGGISRFEKFKIYHKEFLGIKLTDQMLQELCDQFSTLVINKVVDAPYTLGAYDFIRQYYQKYSFHIVSATPQNEIEIIVKLKKLNKYFIEVLGSPEKKYRNINKIISKYNLQLSEICYIGDSINDYNAAKKSGIRFIGFCSIKNNNFPLDIEKIDSFNSFFRKIKL